MWIPEETYTLIRKHVPILCVDLFPCDKRGLLLQRRRYYPDVGQWAIIGGRVRKWESIDHAVERHLRTEIGLEVIKKEFLGYQEYSHQDDPRQHAISLMFYVKPSKKQPADGQFFRIIPGDTVYPAKKVIEKFKRRLPCKLRLVI